MLFFSRDLSVDEKNVYMEALAFILNVGKSNNDAKKNIWKHKWPKSA